MENIAIIIIVAISLSIIFLITTFILTKFILTPYKQESNVVNIGDLISLLHFFIQKEIDLYERDIFSKMTLLNNSNLENYYLDIVNNILNNIPKPYMKRIKYYLTEEYIASIVSRTVMNYLKNKITDVK